MSFHPATGLVYVPTTLAGSRLYATNPNFQYKEGLMNTGQSLGRAANINLAGAPKGVDSNPLPAPPAIGPAPPQGAGGGALLAWDIVNQKERWRAPVGGGAGGGTVSTAGNLVIQVVPDGRLMAYTADKGEKVLEIQTGLRTGAGPPITYLLDGKQYIAFAGGSGGRVVANREAAEGPGGAQPAPAPAGGRGGGTQANTNPKLLVFTLDGKASLPQ
jgi:quinohemoprotein ethanol dehydrogenase